MGLVSMDFSSKNPQNVYSVVDLTRAVKHSIDSTFGPLTVKGEVSNFKAHHSGHWYFTLKDDFSQIPVVMWRGNNIVQKFMPRDGQELFVKGKLTVYERGGRYQFDAAALNLAAEKGDLYKKFEMLKNQLMERGLFDPEIKKDIPAFPHKLVILTSPTGAALQDILNVLARRNPLLQIFLYPIPVQGVGAEKLISAAIEKVNKLNQFDVMLISRGGGSLEDLWPFNELSVAQSIFESVVPVVTGIGHETDFTIADFVADLRAPTPSAAAEMLSPDINEILLKINAYSGVLYQKLFQKISLEKEKIKYGEERLQRGYPALLINQNKQTLDIFYEKMTSSIKHIINRNAERLKGMENILQSLSPHAILDRGYSIVQKGGKSVSSVFSLDEDDKVDLIFRDGNIPAQIKGKANGRQ